MGIFDTKLLPALNLNKWTLIACATVTAVVLAPIIAEAVADALAAIGITISVETLTEVLAPYLERVLVQLGSRGVFGGIPIGLGPLAGAVYTSLSGGLPAADSPSATSAASLVRARPHLCVRPEWRRSRRSGRCGRAT